MTPALTDYRLILIQRLAHIGRQIAVLKNQPMKDIHPLFELPNEDVWCLLVESAGWTQDELLSLPR